MCYIYEHQVQHEILPRWSKSTEEVAKELLSLRWNSKRGVLESFFNLVLLLFQLWLNQFSNILIVKKSTDGVKKRNNVDLVVISWMVFYDPFNLRGMNYVCGWRWLSGLVWRWVCRCWRLIFWACVDDEDLRILWIFQFFFFFWVWVWMTRGILWVFKGWRNQRRPLQSEIAWRV